MSVLIIYVHMNGSPCIILPILNKMVSFSQTECVQTFSHECVQCLLQMLNRLPVKSLKLVIQWYIYIQCISFIIYDHLAAKEKKLTVIAKRVGVIK